MSDGHLNGLDLCMFGWNRADLVAHFISFHRHIFTLDAVGRMEIISKTCVYVCASVCVLDLDKDALKSASNGKMDRQNGLLNDNSYIITIIFKLTDRM